MNTGASTTARLSERDVVFSSCLPVSSGNQTVTSGSIVVNGAHPDPSCASIVQTLSTPPCSRRASVYCLVLPSNFLLSIATGYFVLLILLYIGK